jgi:hypothetical protein
MQILYITQNRTPVFVSFAQVASATDLQQRKKVPDGNPSGTFGMIVLYYFQ